jgi:hypothetical protein
LRFRAVSDDGRTIIEFQEFDFGVCTESVALAAEIALFLEFARSVPATAGSMMAKDRFWAQICVSE